MSGTRTAVLEAARSEIGYSEHPKGSNVTKFASEAGHPNRQSWCSTFISAILIRCNVMAKGNPILAPSSRTMYANAKKAGLAINMADLQPGDVVHNWRGLRIGAWKGHVAFVKQVNRDHRGRIVGIVSIEGNTDRSGSPTGGSVLEKVRTVAAWRVGAWRPPYAK